MAKGRSKKRRSRSGKGRSRGSGYAWFWILGAAALLLMVQAWNMIRKGSEAKFFPVQKVLSFKGEGQACGPFQIWDITKLADHGMALTDPGNGRILIFDRAGSFVRAITEKEAGDPPFKEISGISSDDQNNIYVADAWNGLLRGFTREGKALLKVPVPNSYGPRGVAWGKGDLYVADTGTHRILKLSSAGGPLGIFGRKGSGKGFFSDPVDLDFSPNDRVFIADSDNHRVQQIDQEGQFVRKYDAGGIVSGVAVDRQGRVYAALQDGGSVKVFEEGGKSLGKVVLTEPKDAPLEGVKGLSVSAEGDLIVGRQREVWVLRPVPAP